jgi:hypothetical protein
MADFTNEELYGGQSRSGWDDATAKWDDGAVDWAGANFTDFQEESLEVNNT